MINPPETLARRLALARCSLPMVAALAMAACGGGGGSGSTAQEGSWLTFFPDPIQVVAYPGEPALVSLGATATRTFDRAINVALVDRGGAMAGPPAITAYSATDYGLVWHTDPALAPGDHRSELEVRLCHDDPVTCAEPLPGSPWRLPYRVFSVDPAAFTYAGWESAPSAPFLDNFVLGSLGSSLVSVSAGFYSAVMETWLSSDDGSSWTKQAVTGPTPFTTNFALASGGTVLYLSGGELLDTHSDPTGAFSSEVWKYDGASWVRKTASAGFAPRAGHAMVQAGGALYVVGGKGAAALDDVWKSIDDGATWTKVGGSLAAGWNGATCAVAWQGGLVVVRGNVWSSADGATWTAHPRAWPYGEGVTNCAVLGGRLYLYGGDRVVSSADLATWQLEPHRWSYGGQAPGMAAVNGRLVLLHGWGISVREVTRTVPNPGAAAAGRPVSDPAAPAARFR